ncbi:hypothetical protein ACQKFL_16580 [Vreelandella titanicae]|uniref:hypothetical protein n=1 Tax=Vreelandella titanicae TaxID=664683 RepID=UPI003CFFBD9E|tara:strand:- start:2260 stop:2442 length:183 start_codon:yes stop_codon:yes gene_type:complete
MLALVNGLVVVVCALFMTRVIQQFSIEVAAAAAAAAAAEWLLLDAPYATGEVLRIAGGRR